MPAGRDSVLVGCGSGCSGFTQPATTSNVSGAGMVPGWTCSGIQRSMVHGSKLPGSPSARLWASMTPMAPSSGKVTSSLCRFTKSGFPAPPAPGGP
jgi:hypothetical protein